MDVLVTDTLTRWPRITYKWMACFMKAGRGAPPSKNSSPEPPLKEFLDPPLSKHNMKYTLIIISAEPKLWVRDLSVYWDSEYSIWLIWYFFAKKCIFHDRR